MTEAGYRIVRCSGCNLCYLANPPLEAVAYDEYHESPAPTPIDAYRPESPNRALAVSWHLNQRRVALLKHWAPEGPLLDVGCGRGFFLRTAADAGYAAYGVDVSGVAVDFARTELSVEAGTESLAELIERRRTFRVVTLWHVLEHFLDPFAVLRQVRELLEPGGCCFIEVPNVNGAHFRLSRRRWQGGNHPRYHRTFFSTRTLADALRRNGFSDVRRLSLDYQLPGRGRGTEIVKRILNRAALDSFLDFVATR